MSIKSDGDLHAQLLAATSFLERIATSAEALDTLSEAERVRFINAAGSVFCPDPVERRIRVKARARKRRQDRIGADEKLLHQTGIRTLRQKKEFTTPNVFPPPPPAPDEDAPGVGAPQTADQQHCYVCKTKYTAVHHFYDQMCPSCAEFNYAKRSELADLSGTTALLTGGRVKIGYQAGIKLLRCGASLIVATRFPRNAAARYAAEVDFSNWADRLEIVGLDLRHTPSVEAFCHHVLATRQRLDFIINNACQTVRRPPDFYAHMMEGEAAALESLQPEVLALVATSAGLRRHDMLPASTSALHEGILDAPQLSQTALLPEESQPQSHLFPQGQLDKDLQQVDLRERNSWRLLMHEVSSVELLETQLVNAVAPFVINARLKPLMERTPGRAKHIVNVSAVEGQFYRRYKTTRHPHTNMAKAALNMMTRTSAADYQSSGIHMNSVDTGWVSDEDPVQVAARKTVEQRFHPPLDIVDGAARVVDPLVAGINTGEHLWGQFLKDYKPTDW